VRLGRGAATTYPGSLADSDCIVVEGSNMAECHPVAFRWVMEAKRRGAKIIHVDPRFTRTSAMADIYAPLRAGSDIAFLGGLINYVINSKRWNEDPFFREYVVNYTNATTIIAQEFKDTEELNGVFSGLKPYTGNPINGFVGQYDNASWQYFRTQIGEAGRAAATAQSGEQPVTSGNDPGAGKATPQAAGAPTAGRAAASAQAGTVAIQSGPGAGATTAFEGPPFEPLVRSLLRPAPRRDPSLQDPRCAFQILKRHYSRYTPEMVERVTGCPKEKFLEVAETLLANSGAERTSAFCYAVAWTQHTCGPQTISAAALLQLLLGNMGRPGAGIMALRGHATIQGSTDVPTLYHSIHGYMAHPTVLKNHERLEDYLATETLATSYWSNTPKFMVSYMKSMYGQAATRENDFGFGWHPRISGDHSHMPMFVLMDQGKVRGAFIMGQNPATSINGSLERRALGKLEWLVVKDNFETETAAFWHSSPEVRNGQIKTEDIKTEVFFFPSAQVAEMDGSFTNTQRLIQWHEKAADPPGDCRSDMWFTHQLTKRLKAMYADSTLPRDQGFKNLTWDFDPDGPLPNTKIAGEPDVHKVLKEINGYETGTGRHLASFGELKDDGSTTCASWIYCGVFPAPDRNLAAARKPNPAGTPWHPDLGWGFSWPANRRVLYNRAAARPDGRPWSERKKYIWWDGQKWTGYDVPDFSLNKSPDAKAQPNGIGLDAHSGTDAFIMKADGRGWLFAPSGLVDGPLPTHYEPAESPVTNPLYKQQASPVLKYWKVEGNELAQVGDSRFPIVITTYRLTEHHLSGAMSRWLPWLAELQPELFIEMSPELASAKGISNLDWVRVSSPRGSIRARALVTRRMRPFTIDGKTVHHVGMPWHWGYQGVVTGAVANDLSAMVGDPNVSIHEAKAFVCNVEPDNRAGA
jgi:formate dehydrogenase major subunit